MLMRDYHVHTNFCDGTASPEEVVRAAIRRGMAALGLLVHSYVSFDNSYCVVSERVGEFQLEVSRLKRKYAGQIELLCGVEQDYYSDMSLDGFDYVIGSLHYVRCGEKYYSVDESKDKFVQLAHEHFGGDYYALAEQYYQTLAHLGELKRIDIIGHIDLITKYNEGEKLFSEKDERYIMSYRRAVDALLPLDVPFEINTGAISRGYRTTPYPSEGIMSYIRSLGGKFILSGDSHSTDTLAYQFENWAHLL